MKYKFEVDNGSLTVFEKKSDEFKQIGNVDILSIIDVYIPTKEDRVLVKDVFDVIVLELPVDSIDELVEVIDGLNNIVLKEKQARIEELQQKGNCSFIVEVVVFVSGFFGGLVLGLYI